MTLVLLDTNAYLRLAKRVRPMLGIPFGQKAYQLTILKITEKEVHKSPRLRFLYPWFDEPKLVAERLAKQVRLSTEEKNQIVAAQSIFHGHVLEQAAHYKTPPSPADCYLLAFGQVRPAIVVTDDLSMHQLAQEFEQQKMLWHGHQLLHKLLSNKRITNEQVREIYQALENNDDLPRTWTEVKHTTFKKVFRN